MTIHYRDELQRLTNILLDPEDQYGEMKQTADAMYDLFLSATDFEPDSAVNREDLFLQSGKAIGPVWAAMCIKEFMRTKRFLNGIKKAIERAKEIFPDTILHILYAGTGPFATLALPLTTVFRSDEVQFTFLEINKESVAWLKKTLHVFEANAYVRKIVQCDASTYQAEGDEPIHILMTETMLNALQKEPQVAITLNLVPQIEPQGILIPQNIWVEAAMLSPKKNMDKIMGKLDINDPFYQVTNSLIQLNKDTAMHYAARMTEVKHTEVFPVIKMSILKEKAEEYPQVCLLTTIQVFEDERLTYNQCSLNMAKNIVNLTKVESSIEKIHFQYELNDKPGFSYHIENNSDNSV